MNAESDHPYQSPNSARRRATNKKALIACVIGWFVVLFAAAHVTDPTAERILRYIAKGLGVAIAALVGYGIESALGTDQESVRARSQAVLLEFDEPIRPALERLNKIKGRTEIAGIFLGMTAAAFLAFADIPTRLMRVVLGQVPGQHYLITPTSIYIGIPLILLGIVASILLTSMIVHMFAGPMWETWKRYERRRANVNFELRWSGSMTQGLGVVISMVLALAGVSIILFANSFSRVTDKGVYIRPTFSIVGKGYSWRDVRKMTWDGLYYSVEFGDGYTWVLQPNKPSNEEIVGAINYISQRSGVKIARQAGKNTCGR